MDKTIQIKNYPVNSWLSSAELYKAGATFEFIMNNYGYKREEILRLAGNESTIGTSPKAIAAAGEACKSSNFYDEPHSDELMNSIKEHFAKEIDMNGLSISIGNGMDRVIEQCLNLFCKTGDSIINFSPSFNFYTFSASRLGLNIYDLARNENFYPNLENIEEKINQYHIETKSDIKIIFLCSPNNPTGTICNLKDIEKLAKICEEKNIILFVDHAYIEFTDRHKFDARNIIKRYPNMIIGYTFSKAYGLAGFRIGYALMHDDIQKIYMKYNTPFLCAKPSLKAAKAALLDIEHFNKIIINNQEEKPKLSISLEKLGFKIYPSEANFVLFETGSSRFRNADELLGHLFSKGIILRKANSVSEKAIRMTVGTNPENRRVLDALVS